MDGNMQNQLKSLLSRLNELKEKRIEEESHKDEVIVIEDSDDEDNNMSEIACNVKSEITLHENTKKLISELIDEKLFPLYRDQILNSAHVNTALGALSREVSELRADIKQSEKERRLLEKEVQSLEREMLRKCILVREIPFDQDTTTPEEVITNLLKNFMWITHLEFNNVEILANPRNNSERHTLVVTFENKASARYVLSQSHKLCSTGIFIEPIVTKNAVKRKHKLLKLRREILRLNPDLRVRVSGTELKVGRYTFEWNILNYLSVKNAIWSTKTAVDYLNEATGLNLENFIERMQN